MMKSQRRSDASGASTCPQVSLLITFTYGIFLARVLIGDHVDSGPHDR